MVALEYYDELLVAIVGSLALGAAVGLATPVALVTGLAGGALVATMFVYDAMFRHPPVPPASAPARAAAVVWHGSSSGRSSPPSEVPTGLAPV